VRLAAETTAVDGHVLDRRLRHRRNQRGRPRDQRRQLRQREIRRSERLVAVEHHRLVLAPEANAAILGVDQPGRDLLAVVGAEHVDRELARVDADVAEPERRADLRLDAREIGVDATQEIARATVAGNDLLFDVKEESTLKQGSFFINKMWNALKLVKMWEGRLTTGGTPQAASFAADWFENRLNEVRAEIDELYNEFKLSEILKTVYSLIWDDFCSWYLEWVKPGFEEPIDANVYDKTVDFFEKLMQLLHPFMPFVTEEIYHQLKERKEDDDLTISRMEEYRKENAEILRDGGLLKEVITAIRDARNKTQLRPKDQVKLHIQSTNASVYKNIEGILQKQVNAESVGYVTEAVSNSINVVVQKDKFFIETENQADTSSQKEQLQKDLNYFEGFLASVEKKLGNERFVQNAKPEVVEIERRKKADAEAKIKAIKESLESLN